MNEHNAVVNEQKRRHLRALVLQKLLAKLKALKQQIDSSSASELLSLQDQLDQATVTVKTQEFDPEWRDKIMWMIESYREDIAGRIVTVDVYSIDINKPVENVGDLEVPLLNEQKQGGETKQATILPIGPLKDNS